MPKGIKIALIVFGVIVVGALSYYLFPKSYIKLTFAPDTAQLSIDGGSPRTVNSGGTILVAAGKHTYTLSHDQFDSTTTTITSGNNETKELLVALHPQTAAAQALLNTQNSQYVIERIGAVAQSQGTAAITQNNPILQHLPFYSHSFEIDPCKSQKYPNDATKVALCVYSNDPQSAVEPLVNASIKNLGYNPSDYEIIYEPTDSASGSGSSSSSGSGGYIGY